MDSVKNKFQILLFKLLINTEKLYLPKVLPIRLHIETQWYKLRYLWNVPQKLCLHINVIRYAVNVGNFVGQDHYIYIYTHTHTK